MFWFFVQCRDRNPLAIVDGFWIGPLVPELRFYYMGLVENLWRQSYCTRTLGGSIRSKAFKALTVEFLVLSTADTDQGVL